MRARRQEAIHALPAHRITARAAPRSPPMSSHYQHHVFFCLNEREDGSRCCADFGAKAMQEYAKKRCKELGINGEGRVRINKAGCLDRCELGPVMVVYPEAVWYTFVDKEDIDEIIQSHLIEGKPVERLMVDRPANA
ncbi:ferredoxin [Ralstonia sp. SET104]|nr:ferredoxin [Ralstonia sp. SET104]